MKEFILQYWLEIAFGLAISGIGIGYSKIIKKIHEQDSIKFGVQALLRDRIIGIFNHYKDKGYCPIYALENAEALYKEYHNLGGNGTATALIDKLREMPTESEEI